MKKFKINSDILEETNSKGKKVYKIVSVSPDGIKILTEAYNGVEITKLIPWKDIK